ncbi:MAG: hypothetical protein ACLGH0_14515, partial [Thermoanaerobaculia bacterium]
MLLTRRDLDAYVQQCRDLIRDLDLVLGDRRLEQEGWAFDSAVDFSEIHAFVHPQLSHEPWYLETPFGVTPEEQLRQYDVLARFFRQERIYLPTPYAIELRSFQERLRVDTMNFLLRDANLALEEIARLRQNPETRDVLDGRIDDPAAVLQFFEKYASYFGAIRSGVALDPLRRLRRLLESRHLVPLAAGDAGIHTPIVENRFHRLLRQRRIQGHDPAAGASFIDAVAIELLRQANLDL